MNGVPIFEVVKVESKVSCKLLLSRRFLGESEYVVRRIWPFVWILDEEVATLVQLKHPRVRAFLPLEQQIVRRPTQATFKYKRSYNGERTLDRTGDFPFGFQTLAAGDLITYFGKYEFLTPTCERIRKWRRDWEEDRKMQELNADRGRSGYSGEPSRSYLYEAEISSGRGFRG